MTKLPFTLLILLIWLGSFTLIMTVFDKILDQSGQEIISEIPDDFPVLVIWKDKGTYDAEVLFYKDLKDFTSNLTNYTYLVPGGFEKSLNEIVHQKSKGVINLNFQILKKYPDGTQLLKVEATDDWRGNTVWYKATKNNFIPQKILAAHTLRMRVPIGTLSFPISLIFSFFVGRAIKKKYVYKFFYKPSDKMLKFFSKLDAQNGVQKEERPPLNTFRFAGEIAAGAAGGLIFLLMPTLLSKVIFLIGNIDQIINYPDLLDLLYLLYPLGTSIGIYLVGNTGDESGSFKATLIGSYIGGLVSVACVCILLIFLNRIIILVVAPLITSLLATFEFNQTRKYKKTKVTTNTEQLQ